MPTIFNDSFAAQQSNASASIVGRQTWGHTWAANGNPLVLDDNDAVGSAAVGDWGSVIMNFTEDATGAAFIDFNIRIKQAPNDEIDLEFGKHTFGDLQASNFYLTITSTYISMRWYTHFGSVDTPWTLYAGDKVSLRLSLASDEYCAKLIVNDGDPDYGFVLNYGTSRYELPDPAEYGPTSLALSCNFASAIDQINMTYVMPPTPEVWQIKDDFTGAVSLIMEHKPTVLTNTGEALTAWEGNGRMPINFNPGEGSGWGYIINGGFATVKGAGV